MDTLTREAIEAMPAGPAMDKLIALQVMGFSMYHYDKDVAENCYFTLLDSEMDPVVFRPRFRDGEHAAEEKAWADCPAFSTDIAAAKEVQAKLFAAGYDLQIWQSRNPSTGGQFMVQASKNAYYSLDAPEPFYAEAMTEPLALCRLALLVALATPVSPAPAVPASV